jgi:hypothetical protein
MRTRRRVNDSFTNATTNTRADDADDADERRVVGHARVGA